MGTKKKVLKKKTAPGKTGMNKPLIKKSISSRNAIYRRVSTGPQDKNGFGLRLQLKAAKRKLRELGYSDYRLFSDKGVSGDTDERERLNALRKAILDGEIDVLILYSLCRLSRRPAHLKKLLKLCRKYDVRIVTCLEGLDTEQKMISQRNRVAEYMVTIQSAAIKKNTEEGKRFALLMGRVIGRLPYGIGKENGRPVFLDAEIAVVRQIFMMHNNGKSGRQIADHLNSVGIPSPAGSEWNHDAVYGLLRNEKFLGVLHTKFAGEEFTSYCPEIRLFEDLKMYREIDKRWIDYVKEITGIRDSSDERGRDEDIR